MNIFEYPFYERTKALVGIEGLTKLASAHVAVFGIGGVGSYAFEALVRAGVGKLTIIDGDVIEESNCNRQLIALKSTVGKIKVDVAQMRGHEINPTCQIDVYHRYLTPENIHFLQELNFTHAIDAIDSIQAKIALIRFLKEGGNFFVSCMGGALRLDPTQVRVSDISQTHTCPHAKSVRRHLRALGIENGVICIYSVEHPKERTSPLGSISYVPGIIGLTAAGIIIKNILESN